MRSQLAQRVAELVQHRFETEQALRQATDELDAARAVNRELMVRANRTDATRPHAQPRQTTAEERV